MKYKPPFDWTSTQLEGAIPNLCDSIGYDVPLSLVFVNDGAPLFKFHPEEMSIKFNMDVQVWDEGFTKNFMDIHFDELLIKFDMKLAKNLTLFVDWETIQMRDARVVPHIELEDQQMDNKVVRDYFNWVFMELLPWANEFHPPSVTRFQIGNHFPGIVDIDNLNMEVKEHYISFGMDPEFLTMQGEPPKWRSMPVVRAARPSLLEHIFNQLFVK